MIITMAWRNIWRNKMRSMATILSVMTGFFAGLTILALYKGMMHSRIRTVIEKETGHMQIHHPEFKKDYDARDTIPELSTLTAFLHQSAEVESFALRSTAQGMLSATSGSAGVIINGVYPTEEKSVSHLHDKIIDGVLVDSMKHNHIIIGKKLADKLKLKKGGKIVLTFTDREQTIISGAFRIQGIYQTINTPMDERNVYVQQKNLNEMLGIGKAATEIALILKNDESIESVKAILQKRFSSSLTETWKDISPETALMVVSINQYMYIIMVIIMLALAFGIVNTMLMAILERTREIGIIIALGMNRLRLFVLILSETILLTMAGTPPGFMLGWYAVSYFNKHGINMSRYSKEALSSFGFESIIYPEFPYEKILPVLCIVSATAILSSVMPSIKALRLQPADALRR